MNDPIRYLSFLLALGVIFTPISLFENDEADNDGDGAKILTFPCLNY